MVLEQIKGFEKVLSIDEKGRKEFEAIKEMLSIISKIKGPDIIAGHNLEKPFDWNFIIVRCEMLGYPLNELSLEYFTSNI